MVTAVEDEKNITGTDAGNHVVKVDVHIHDRLMSHTL